MNLHLIQGLYEYRPHYLSFQSSNIHVAFPNIIIIKENVELVLDFDDYMFHLVTHFKGSSNKLTPNSLSLMV